MQGRQCKKINCKPRNFGSYFHLIDQVHLLRFSSSGIGYGVSFA
jgi:hypothetical protein